MSKDERREREDSTTKREREEREEMLDEWREMSEAAGQRAGTAQVNRVIKHQPDVYLDTVPYDEIRTEPQNYLRGRWGGGRFKVQLKDADKKYLKKATMYFSIEGDPVLQGVAEVDPVETEVARRVELALAQSNGDRDHQAVYVEMIKQSGEQVRAAIEAGAKSNDNRTDPMEMALGFMTAMQAANAPLLAAVLDAKSQGPAESIQMLTAVMELAQNMGGDGGGIGSLAKTMAEPLAKLVDAHLAAQPKLAGGATPEAKAAVRPPWFPHLAPLLPALLGWAQGNKDPILRADLVMDELRDDQIAPVFQALTAEGFRPEFFQQVPEAAPHSDWFAAFFDAMVAGIDWKPEGEMPEGAPEVGTGEPPAGEDPPAEGPPADETEETTAGTVPTHAEG